MSDSEEILGIQQSKWASGLRQAQQSLLGNTGLVPEGRLRRMIGLTLEAEGCQAAVGDLCSIRGAHQSDNASKDIEAEVVGFSDERLFLMPTGRVQGLTGNLRVRPSQRSSQVGVGESLLGRVIDGSGKPLDALGPCTCNSFAPLQGVRINPLDREPVAAPLDVGVRAINSLLTVGRGQRVGLFAGSGVGKSVLLGMMTKYSAADVVVVGLIGERGREVREFIENNIGEEGMRRTVVVASPADDPPLLRLHGAMLATTIAEDFRSKGLNVLLLMDSLTRFAQAQREIALSIGEPPVTRGYPPSVFSKLPQLCERAGNGGNRGGSITAIYTVLAEGDDQNDPVADAARAILDGHIVLSRDIAMAGLFPAIDIAASASRTMDQVVSPEHVRFARHFRRFYAAYRENQDLLSIGAYQQGSNADVDAAVALWPGILEFLRQESDVPCNFDSSLQSLEGLFTAPVVPPSPVSDKAVTAEVTAV